MAEGFDIFGGYGASSPSRRSRPTTSSSSSERRGFDVFGGHGSTSHRNKTGARIDEGTLGQVEKNVGGAVKVLKVLGFL